MEGRRRRKRRTDVQTYKTTAGTHSWQSCRKLSAANEFDAPVRQAAEPSAGQRNRPLPQSTSVESWDSAGSFCLHARKNRPATGSPKAPDPAMMSRQPRTKHLILSVGTRILERSFDPGNTGRTPRRRMRAGRGNPLCGVYWRDRQRGEWERKEEWFYGTSICVALSRARALFSVSSYSALGSESATMPAPDWTCA